MPDPSCLQALDVLQQRGLTYDLLRLFVLYCERQKTGGGSFVFCTNEGYIVGHEEHHKGRVAKREQEVRCVG